MTEYGHPNDPIADYIDRLRAIIDSTNRHLFYLGLLLALIFVGVLVPSIDDLQKYKKETDELLSSEQNFTLEQQTLFCVLLQRSDADSLDQHIDFGQDGKEQTLCSCFCRKSSLPECVSSSADFCRPGTLADVDYIKQIELISVSELTRLLEEDLEPSAYSIISEMLEKHGKFEQSTKEKATILSNLKNTRENVSFLGYFSLPLPIELVPIVASALVAATAMIILLARSSVASTTANAFAVLRTRNKESLQDWLGRSPFWLQPLSGYSERETVAIASAVGGRVGRLATWDGTLMLIVLSSLGCLLVISASAQLLLAHDAKWINDIMQYGPDARRGLVHLHVAFIALGMIVFFAIFLKRLIIGDVRSVAGRREMVMGLVSGAFLGIVCFNTYRRFSFARFREEEDQSTGKLSRVEASDMRRDSASGVKKTSFRYVAGSGMPGRFRKVIVSDNSVREVEEVSIDEIKLEAVRESERAQVIEAIAFMRIESEDREGALEMLKEGLIVASQRSSADGYRAYARLVHLAARIISASTPGSALSELRDFVTSIKSGSGELPPSLDQPIQVTINRVKEGRDPRMPERDSWTLPYLDGKKYSVKLRN